MYYTQTTSDQYYQIAHRMMIISGTLMFLFGLIGNLLNIYIFTQWSRSGRKSKNKSSKTSNISLYLLTSSLSNLIVIIYPLLTRIMVDGYQYPITSNKNYLLCKIRYYALHTFDLLSLTCICMAILDRYLVSSRKVYLRKIVPKTNRTIFNIVFVFLLIAFHNIPLIIYFDVANNGRCLIFSLIYSYYYLYIFQICLHGLFPILFLSIFGVLTWKQLRILTKNTRSNHRNIDRQLSRMLLLISLGIIVSSTPNCIENLYGKIFVRDSIEYSSKFYFYHIISSILYYINPVMSFYILFISTPNFRYHIRHLCPK